VTQTWRYAKITQKLENHLEQDINAIQQQIKHLQDIGLARCGEEILCHIVQEKIV
jgi:hypothetical protein